jgi:hypothetical protein
VIQLLDLWQPLVPGNLWCLANYFSLQLPMMPRPHPGTKEKQHHRFALHIGSPRPEYRVQRVQGQVIYLPKMFPIDEKLEFKSDNMTTAPL